MSIVGQILDRQLKPRKVSKELPAETRNKYLEDAQMFARSLAETLNEPEGTVKPKEFLGGSVTADFFTESAFKFSCP